MKLFNKSLSKYWQHCRTGVYLLALVSVIRFLMKPVFNVPYTQGTHFTSVTILLLVLMVVYAVRANAAGMGSYRDLLGIALTLSMSSAALILLGIAIDDFGRIDTYYTDLAHGGNLNTWLHMGGHVVAGLVSSLFLWGVGSLVYFLAGLSRKKAVA
ncbi:MAG: hypothetical protein ONB46_21005 [candidate division KSB1 bacterium]|nr:hypothetical protein [candidate division KSB1 bacterium]MDZ7368420.1 hypothetical protein [candidate division KSB1 bacterium]MDZ7406004.1 hypothetical protein [candidate division KSB1 bacterium]